MAKLLNDQERVTPSATLFLERENIASRLYQTAKLVLPPGADVQISAPNRYISPDTQRASSHVDLIWDINNRPRTYKAVRVLRMDSGGGAFGVSTKDGIVPMLLDNMSQAEMVDWRNYLAVLGKTEDDLSFEQIAEFAIRKARPRVL